jgi:hypothetical protein
VVEVKTLYPTHSASDYSPTSARITVSKGAIGNRTATLNSSIWRRSTVKREEEKGFEKSGV